MQHAGNAMVAAILQVRQDLARIGGSHVLSLAVNHADPEIDVS